jgi:hypothetical protein
VACLLSVRSRRSSNRFHFWIYIRVFFLAFVFGIVICIHPGTVTNGYRLDFYCQVCILPVKIYSFHTSGVTIIPFI